MPSKDTVKNAYKSRQLTGSKRARVVSWVGWPESMDIERMDSYIENAHVQAARSPLHNLDEYDRNDVEGWLYRHKLPVDLDWTQDELMAWCAKYSRLSGLDIPWIGDLKKEHYHYVAAFEGSKNAQQVIDMLGGMITYVEKVDSKQGTLKYLIHKNSPDKHQYSFEDIKTFGGMDVSCILAMGEVERMDYKDRVIDHIYDGHCNSFNQLVKWARSTGDFNLKATVYANKYLFDGLIYSRNMDRAAARRALGAAPEGLEEFESGMFQGLDYETGEIE